MNKTNKSLAQRIICGETYSQLLEGSYYVRQKGRKSSCIAIATDCAPEIGGDQAANAALIVEAFNVTHETGKTPRELLSAITEINDIIFGFPGAPVGSVNYFKIREICCNIIWPQK